MIFLRQARRNAIKMVGEKTSSLELARSRLVLMSAFFVLAYIILAARAVDLMVIQAQPVLADNGLTLESTPAATGIARADITDRNGELLATTIKTASLYADPHLISEKEIAAQKLAKIFPDLGYGETLQKLQDKKRFILLKRNLTPPEQHKVLEIGEPGLAFQYEDRRVYPQGNLTSHLVGYAGVDNQGLAGIERSFNQLLGEGKPVALTIDIRLQHALRREMEQAISDFSAKNGGAGVIMDVRTGDVLAAISLPDFDPQNVGKASQKSTFNRLSLGTYELGSVFKIFSVAAFLETHNVPMSASFDATKPLKRDGFVISDYHAQDRVLTIPEIFMYSSNIGAAMMGEAVGTDRLKKFYDDIGLLRTMSIELPEVARPQVPNPWRDINTLTASYGHGVATTPLQLASAVSSIANGGYLVKPHLVLNEKAGNNKPDESLRVVSPQTAHRMLQLMRLVVTDGTGEKANVPGYFVGGKTGTAEKPGDHGGYDHAKLLSSFVAVFPVDNPEYVVFIVIDEPQPTKKSFGYATGGWVAAPAVARVVSAMASILGLKPEGENIADLSASLKQFVMMKGND